VGTAVAPGELLPLLAQDKKRAGGKGRWVLVRRPGEAQVVTAPEESRVLRALEAVHQPPPEPAKDPGTGSGGES
jgi:3-dehydroquinate synthetase